RDRRSTPAFVGAIVCPRSSRTQENGPRRDPGRHVEIARGPLNRCLLLRTANGIQYLRAAPRGTLPVRRQGPRATARDKTLRQIVQAPDRASVATNGVRVTDRRILAGSVRWTNRPRRARPTDRWAGESPRASARPKVQRVRRRPFDPSCAIAWRSAPNHSRPDTGSTVDPASGGCTSSWHSRARLRSGPAPRRAFEAFSSSVPASPAATRARVSQ